jgi:hypothetical protein
MFFPMHFLGLMGMPRRIPDYPDIYSYWNDIATYGLLLTIIALIIFIILLIEALCGMAKLHFTGIYNKVHSIMNYGSWPIVYVTFIIGGAVVVIGNAVVRASVEVLADIFGH